MVGQALPFWTDLLRLPDYEVVFCQEESDLRRYRFTVAPKHRIGICPHCKKASESVHQTRTREGIKDLSISKYAVEINVRILQFDCERCGQAFTLAVPVLWRGPTAQNGFLNWPRGCVPQATWPMPRGSSASPHGRWENGNMRRCRGRAAQTWPKLK